MQKESSKEEGSKEESKEAENDLGQPFIDACEEHAAKFGIESVGQFMGMFDIHNCINMVCHSGCPCDPFERTEDEKERT